MSEDFTEKLGAVEGRVAALEGNVGMGLDGRVTALEVRMSTSEAGAGKDRQQVTELAKKVDSLTVTQQTQLEILKRLDAIASNPHFKVILAVVATALASWAASRGLK